MGRCEAYYRTESRRCDRDAVERVHAVDGEDYDVCAYHARECARSAAARWNGDTERRAAPVVSLAVG